MPGSKHERIEETGRPLQLRDLFEAGTGEAFPGGGDKAAIRGGPVPVAQCPTEMVRVGAAIFAAD